MSMGLRGIKTPIELGMEFLVLNNKDTIEHTNVQRQAANYKSKKCLV